MKIENSIYINTIKLKFLAIKLKFISIKFKDSWTGEGSVAEINVAIWFSL